MASVAQMTCEEVSSLFNIGFIKSWIDSPVLNYENNVDDDLSTYMMGGEL